MRTTLILAGAALWVGVMCFGADDQQAVPKNDKPVTSQPATKSGAKPIAKAAEKIPASPLGDEKQSLDEEAIRQADEAFVKAYEKGDAQAAASLFAPDAEYVDELGNVSQGRDEIEKSLAEFFTANPGCKLELNIDSIRFVSPGVAVEDGSTRVTHPNSSLTVDATYSTVYVKADGKWLAASVRDHAPKNRRQHRAQLKQLDFLLGDWVDEGNDAIVKFSCQPVENGNFLLRKFTVHMAGLEAMTGTQRIGWDPLTSKFKAWIFDSEGGHFEGYWHRDGDNWVLKTNGVTADGETASGTSIYTFVNAHTMTWQSVHREIGGVQLPDSEIAHIVRQPPAPEAVKTVERKAAD